jgi:anti-sigma factor RsiW
MASRREKDLQQYFDGELGVRRARKVRQQMEQSPEDQRRLQELQRMRGLMRESTTEAVSEVSFDSLWAKVQVGIAAAKPLPWSERVRTWLRRYGLVTASAVAAVVLVTALVWPMETVVRNECDIESIDVDPEVALTIFTIDSPDKDDKTTVIWVDEDKDHPQDKDLERETN